MKGLRLSQPETGLSLSLLVQLSLCLKWFSQEGSQLRPSLSNNHSGFLCHVTIFCSQNIILMAYMFFFSPIISLIKYQRLLQGVVLYTWTLFSAISNFEVKKELWRPYLSLCLQNLSPLCTSLNI